MEEFNPVGASLPEEDYSPEDEYAPIDDAVTADGETQSAGRTEPLRPGMRRPGRYPYEPAYPEYPHPASSLYPYPPQAAYPPVTPPYDPYRIPVQPYPAAPLPYYPPAQSYYPQPQAYYPAVQPAYPQPQPQQPPQPATPPVPPAPPAPPQPPLSAVRDNPYTDPAPATAYSPAPAAAPQAAVPMQKPPTSTGTKVFLIILIALLVGLLVGFWIYIAHLADDEKKNADNNNGSVVVPDNYDHYFDDYSDDEDQQSYNGFEEISREISLVEDKGETQQRSDDNPDTVGQPDEKAKSIVLNAVPKDKEDEKYTTQSAYDAVADSVVTVELYEGEITDKTGDLKGSGTGTIISEDGYIVTNAHVVGNSRHYAVKISLNSGKTYQAKVIGYDTWTDLAVLKVDAKGLKPVTFGDPDHIEIGQDVFAIGSPGGEKFKNSLTKGIVSAVDRELSINKYVKYIQSDAAISPGNSGGPLCNIYGQVIGINTAKTTATNYEAMTFSIPSDTVKEIVTELLHYGYVRGRTRIGFSGAEVSIEEQYYYGYPAGVIIGEIDPNGSFAGVDIKEGDILTAIDGEEVTSFQDIYAVLNQHKPGDKVEITISRAK